jgi:hypothetical protein
MAEHYSYNHDLYLQSLEIIKKVRGEGLFRGRTHLFENKGVIVFFYDFRASEIAYGQVELHFGNKLEDTYILVRTKEDTLISIKNYNNDLEALIRDAVKFARQNKDYRKTFPGK